MYTYEILIKQGKGYVPALNTAGNHWQTTDITTLQAKLRELLSTETFDSLRAVVNVEITPDIAVTEPVPPTPTP